MPKLVGKGWTVGPFWFVLCLAWSWSGWTITDRHGDRYTFAFKMSKAVREGHPPCWNVTILCLDVMVGVGRKARL